MMRRAARVVLAASALVALTTGFDPAGARTRLEAQAACPCTIWDSSVVPPVIDSNDTSAVELGLRFRADLDGAITGARFYKSDQNIGTHLARL